jgi:hypothetical protein
LVEITGVPAASASATVRPKFSFKVGRAKTSAYAEAVADDVIGIPLEWTVGSPIAHWCPIPEKTKVVYCKDTNRKGDYMIWS